MLKTSCCAQTVHHAETDLAHLIFVDTARGAAAVWRDFIFMVDSALQPVAFAVTALRSWNAKARRLAMWSSMSDHDLRDVGLARGCVDYFDRNPEEAREIRPASRFE